MSRPETKRAIRAIAAAVAFGALLAGCSDLYWDRRETIALSGGDAVSANMVEQMVDPWPRYSSNKNLAFNGERMQRAVECYRKDKVTQPTDLNPSSDSSSGSTPSPVAGDSCTGQMSTGSAPAASGAAVTGSNSGAHY